MLFLKSATLALLGFCPYLALKIKQFYSFLSLFFWDFCYSSLKLFSYNKCQIFSFSEKCNACTFQKVLLISLKNAMIYKMISLLFWDFCYSFNLISETSIGYLSVFSKSATLALFRKYKFFRLRIFCFPQKCNTCTFGENYKTDLS